MNPPRVVDFRKQKKLTATYGPETILQLLNFGSLMTAEVQQRSAQIDAKLGSYLGYSVALIGLLGVGSVLSDSDPLLFRVGILMAAAFAILAIVVIFRGIKGREAPVPSEEDWFNRDWVKDVEGLRMAQLTALHASHNILQIQNYEKGNSLKTAEWLMGLAGILAGIVLIVRIFFFLLTKHPAP